MLYLSTSQNNRLGTPGLPKRVLLHSEEENTSDCSSEHLNDEPNIKREFSEASTLSSCSHSHRDSFSDDGQSIKELEDSEECLDFTARGFCLSGRDCAGSHSCREESQCIRPGRGKFRLQLLEHFPQLLPTVFFRRIPSFLQ